MAAPRGGGGGSAFADALTDGGAEHDMARALQGAAGQTARKIKISGPSVEVASGNIDLDGAKAAARRSYPALKASYERALKRAPRLGGKVTLQITVSQSGAMANLKVLDENFNDQEMLASVLAVVRGWRFPSAQGKPAVLEATWVFRYVEPP
jgi:TonB family protein